MSKDRMGCGLRGWAVLVSVAGWVGMVEAGGITEIVVDGSGMTEGAVRSVQEAIEAVPAGNQEVVRILIKPGVYRQQVTIPADRPHLRLIGLGRGPEETVLTFNLHAKSPKPGGAEGELAGTTGSSSTFIFADDVQAENLTFANDTPDNVAQAVAIKTIGDRLVFRRCRFVGYQDTLYLTRGRVYLEDCYIAGDVDFIFGDATAVFDRCVIESRDKGYITAANTLPERAYGFVFLDCRLVAAERVKPETVWLGRPWQWDRGRVGAVAFIRCQMGPHIRAEGWHPWNVERNTEPGKTSRFAEFGSMDLEGRELDLSRRVPWARRLSAREAEEYRPEKVLGDWQDWRRKN